MTADEDETIAAAFGAAEREIETGEFPAAVQRALKRRARTRLLIVLAAALAGGLIAGPQLVDFVFVVNHRLEDVSPLANGTGWLIVAIVAGVVLEIALRPADRPGPAARS